MSSSKRPPVAKALYQSAPAPTDRFAHIKENEDRSVTMDHPILVRLYRFTELVAGVMECEPENVLGDFRDIVPSELSMDRTYLTRVGEGAYLLAEALYRLQNRECINRLRLFHIVQYDSWTARFLVLLQCIRERADDSETLRWFNLQTAFPAPAATEPVRYAPVHTDPLSTEEWVQEAMGHNATSKLVLAMGLDHIATSKLVLAIELALHALGPDATLDRVTRSLHGRAEFARLAAAMVDPKAKPVDASWLIAFLHKDCACAF